MLLLEKTSEGLGQLPRAVTALNTIALQHVDNTALAPRDSHLLSLPLLRSFIARSARALHGPSTLRIAWGPKSRSVESGKWTIESTIVLKTQP